MLHSRAIKTIITDQITKLNVQRSCSPLSRSRKLTVSSPTSGIITSPINANAGIVSQKSANFQFKRPESRANSTARIARKKDLIDPAKAGYVGKLGNNVLPDDVSTKMPQIEQILTTRKSLSSKRRQSKVVAELPHLRAD